MTSCYFSETKLKFPWCVALRMRFLAHFLFLWFGFHECYHFSSQFLHRIRFSLVKISDEVLAIDEVKAAEEESIYE